MPRWPLLLPPPAVSISPSRLRCFLSSIVVESKTAPMGHLTWFLQVNKCFIPFGQGCCIFKSQKIFYFDQVIVQNQSWTICQSDLAEQKNRKQTCCHEFFWTLPSWLLLSMHKSTTSMLQSNCLKEYYSFGGKPPKAWQPLFPTNRPTDQPTNQPTDQLTNRPTNQLTNQPTNQPTDRQTDQPTDQLTNRPRVIKIQPR